LTTATIPTLTLNNGVEMPAFGLGVFQSPPEETANAVEAAIANGYPLLDAAAAYGNEREVGEGIRRAAIDRSQIFIVTKLWISDYGYDEALVGFDGCLRRLGVDYVDLFLLHHPVPSEFNNTVGAYKAIEEMLAAGRTRAIGVANFMEDHLEDLLNQVDVVPAVNQIEVHPYFSQPQLRSLMAQHGIVTQAWSPIGGVYAYGAQNTPVLDDPAIVELAAKPARRLHRSSCAGTSNTASAPYRNQSSHTASPRTSTSSTSSSHPTSSPASTPSTPASAAAPTRRASAAPPTRTRLRTTNDHLDGQRAECDGKRRGANAGLAATRRDAATAGNDVGRPRRR
jgi:diketogulonate reductase-like aldo/keto reductase